MHILVSNDDGYLSLGLHHLVNTLHTLGHHVTVVAPERDRSGASHALTLKNPLRVYQADNGFMYVNGTPADCVYLALTALLETPPDLVVSGINMGANLGDDVLYSGTVAAAMEGRSLALPAIAISIDNFSPQHIESAGKAITHILADIVQHKFQLKRHTILNINVPDKPWQEIQGIKVTQLGHRHAPMPAITEQDPRGKPIYWIGGVGEICNAEEGTDFHAVSKNYISITPLHFDYTAHDSVTILKHYYD